MIHDLIWKVFRFSVVGTSGVAIDFGVTFLCKEKIKLNPFLANSFGFTVAATSNFYWNKVWTFQDENADYGSQYLTFIAIAIFGLIINNMILWLLTTKLKWSFYFSKLIAIGTVVIWNFTLNYLWTFA